MEELHAVRGLLLPEKIACVTHDKLIRARPIVGRDRVCCTACRGLHAPVLLEVV